MTDASMVEAGRFLPSPQTNKIWIFWAVITITIMNFPGSILKGDSCVDLNGFGLNSEEGFYRD